MHMCIFLNIHTLNSIRVEAKLRFSIIWRAHAHILIYLYINCFHFECEQWSMRVVLGETLKSLLLGRPLIKNLNPNMLKTPNMTIAKASNGPVKIWTTCKDPRS